LRARFQPRLQSFRHAIWGKQTGKLEMPKAGNLSRLVHCAAAAARKVFAILINASAQLKFIGQKATPTQRKLQHANAVWGKVDWKTADST